jgi:hypothetical protein
MRETGRDRQRQRRRERGRQGQGKGQSQGTGTESPRGRQTETDRFLAMCFDHMVKTMWARAAGCRRAAEAPPPGLARFRAISRAPLDAPPAQPLPSPTPPPPLPPAPRARASRMAAHAQSHARRARAAPRAGGATPRPCWTRRRRTSGGSSRSTTRYSSRPPPSPGPAASRPPFSPARAGPEDGRDPQAVRVGNIPGRLGDSAMVSCPLDMKSRLNLKAQADRTRSRLYGVSTRSRLYGRLYGVSCHHVAGRPCLVSPYSRPAVSRDTV